MNCIIPYFLFIVFLTKSFSERISFYQNDVYNDSRKTSKSTFNMTAIIEKVNSIQTTWKAGYNFPLDTPKSYFKTLTGALIRDETKMGFKYVSSSCDCNNKDLPVAFDARKRWNGCPSISHIYDQGNCGSCWAVAPASVYTDRNCIAKNGTSNPKFAAQALISCCRKCGYGCNGGYIEEAWKYFKNHGIVTGGDYNSNEGCQPYLQTPCEHANDGPLHSCSSLPDEKAAKCKLRCYNKKYGIPWKRDLHTAKSHYSICPCGAMNEIYSKGPIGTAFNVFEDFPYYKSGVYQYTAGDIVGGHAVRVLGWGEENGIPYWLATNSWNKNWGISGTFKIKRGNNEVGFEYNFYSGIPHV